MAESIAETYEILLQPCVENIQVIAPGLVYIKGGIGPELSTWLANFATEVGKDPQTGFWKIGDDGEKIDRGAAQRGRVYQRLDLYREHEKLRALCGNIVDCARKASEVLPPMLPTHMLLLQYRTPDGMCWHRDSDPNDGLNDHPIVSISLGNTCTFGYKRLLRPDESVELESGDVLVWGGPQRMLEHCVREVKMETAPPTYQKKRRTAAITSHSEMRRTY